MSKTIQFKKANTQQAAPAADEWVKERTPEPAAAVPETMKRLTIDVPQSLHTRVKIGCATKGKKMADLVREMLEREFPAA